MKKSIVTNLCSLLSLVVLVVPANAAPITVSTGSLSDGYTSQITPYAIEKYITKVVDYPMSEYSKEDIPFTFKYRDPQGYEGDLKLVTVTEDPIRRIYRVTYEGWVSI